MVALIISVVLSNLFIKRKENLRLTISIGMVMYVHMYCTYIYICKSYNDGLSELCMLSTSYVISQS